MQYLISIYFDERTNKAFRGYIEREEYFAYDPDEYYEALQMGLPVLYYSGRENPPHPEIWINYFLRMVELYSKKVCELSKGVQADDLDGSLSYLNARERDLLCAKLTNNGFLVPNIVSQRIRSYSLSEFAKRNEKKILSKIG